MSESADEAVAALLDPPRLWTREEVLGRGCPVPDSPGVYAWYFRELPAEDIDPSECHMAHGLPMLYTGISPKRPSADGRRPSAQTVRKRVRYHYLGNAEGSTLRLTLGCLLGERLGIALRRVGNGRRMTFASGETRLSEWMGANALVCWATAAAPWDVESGLIADLELPLNLDQNREHPFHAGLSQRRAGCRRNAREQPVVPPADSRSTEGKEAGRSWS